MTLARSMATPLTKLNTPNAVPRSWGGAASATMAANSFRPEPHMQGPQGDAEAERPEVARDRQDGVRRDQEGDPGSEQSVP